MCDLIARYGELSARELSDKLGISLAQGRRRVNSLIAKGVVEAIAPATSRNRKYRIAI